MAAAAGALGEGPRALVAEVGSGERARSRALPRRALRRVQGVRAPGARRMERAGRAAYSEHEIEAIRGGPSPGGSLLGA